MTVTTEPKKSGSGEPVGPVPPRSDRSNEILAIWDILIRTSLVPQFLIDRNHCVIAWNGELETVTGMKEEDILGTTRHWKAFYDEKRPCLADLLVDDTPGDLAVWYQGEYDRSGRTGTAYHATDFFPHLGEGGKWLHFTAVPIRDGTGTVIGAVESFEDVSKRQTLERALALSDKKLNLMNSVAGHEIENKITGVRGYVELTRGLISDDERGKCFDAEENALKQIHELLKSMMDYQMIGAQPPRWINLTETIRSIVSLMEIESLHIEINVDAVELFGDPTLAIMFSYLIKNTISRVKTVPEIRVSFAEIPEGLRLAYEDNSAGIPPDRKECLFKESIVNSDNFCMKFVHDILEFSGMCIKETGAPGKGTRFEIFVPHGVYRFTGTQE